MIGVCVWIVVVILFLVGSYHFFLNIRSKQPYFRKGLKPINSQQALKIIFHGNCASGKSTLSKQLSKKLNLPLIDSDFHRFYPAHEHVWKIKSHEEFISSIDLDMEQWSNKGWIFDGRILQLPSVVREGNVLIVMDYALIVTFWRLFVRTLSRCIFRTRCCNGNVENLWNQFCSGSDSLFMFEFKCALRRKEREKSLLARIEENPNLHVFKFVSPKETEEFLKTFNFTDL